MCGFVAVIGPGEPVARSILERMRDQLSHRGPDGEGIWYGSYEQGSVSLGFRRLAIIDTRHVADQPMVSADGRCVIVFNGEIYNYVELRAELETAGRVFRTRSDTEVLLQAYEHWGEDVVDRLNGMFTFVIWDERRGRAFVGRDRFGEKPLFVCKLPGGKLALASEIKAILAHPEADDSYDLDMFGQILGGHLLFGTDETIFGNVQQFRPGHCMTVSGNGDILRERRYWVPSYDRSLADIGLEVLSERLRDHLRRSAVMRMRSDVPVTACLSGGLDSSSLVALLARTSGKNVGKLRSAISARFPEDPTIDEGRFIDMVLCRTALEGHAVSPTASDLIRDLRQLHWHHETIIPGPSMYLEWSIMRQARALGYKVIIDGQGADEILAGYAIYLQAYQAELASWGLIGYIKALHVGRQRDRRLRQAAELYANSERRFSSRDSLEFREILDFSKHTVARRWKEYAGDGLPPPLEVGALRFELALNLLRTSLPSNLHSGDRNSMAHGIECRYPYLDYELVDFSTQLPDGAYLDNAWGKSVLRIAMSDLLPPAVTWRPDKVGFAAPQDVWMASEKMKTWLEERIFDRGLYDIPGYTPGKIREAWEEHRKNIKDQSATLWQWASAAELLDMSRKGEWSGKPVPTCVASISNTCIEPASYLLLGNSAYYRPGTNDGNRTAWVISYTPVSKEPRVIRQVKALENAGWRVFVFGMEGKAPCPLSWHFVSMPNVGPRYHKILDLLMALARLAGVTTARFGYISGLKSLGARLAQLCNYSYFWKRRIIERFAKSFPQHHPSLVLCHDYYTADVALKIAQFSNARTSVDCHEYALTQYAHEPRWLKWYQPVVRELQNYLYARVDGITCVCQGIAELIDKDHELRRPVQVVRSVPFYISQPFRPTSSKISVLYHGEIFHTRMLHVAVRSMRLWRPEFRLVLRGYSDPAYVAQLREIAAEVGVDDRLEIHPPVAFDQIVPAANQADVGYFVHLDTSPQRRFVLPNKFFEYIMAGLALVVSDLPEMARVVRQYELGTLVPDCGEESIARAINSLNRESIDKMKRRSLAAAKELNWEEEEEKMLALYGEILK